MNNKYYDNLNMHLRYMEHIVHKHVILFYNDFESYMYSPLKQIERCVKKNIIPNKDTLILITTPFNAIVNKQIFIDIIMSIIDRVIDDDNYQLTRCMVCNNIYFGCGKSCDAGCASKIIYNLNYWNATPHRLNIQKEDFIKHIPAVEYDSIVGDDNINVLCMGQFNHINNNFQSDIALLIDYIDASLDLQLTMHPTRFPYNMWGKRVVDEIILANSKEYHGGLVNRKTAYLANYRQMLVNILAELKEMLYIGL
jgi:hypothetical protein